MEWSVSLIIEEIRNEEITNKLITEPSAVDMLQQQRDKMLQEVETMKSDYLNNLQTDFQSQYM